MNNDLEQFSEERLKEIVSAIKLEPCDYHAVYDRILHMEIAALARIALAAKQAKPVAYTDNLSLETLQLNGMACMWKEGNGAVWREQIPLYTTPQPAHTGRVIPDGWKLVPEEATIGMLTLLGMTGSFEFMQQKYKNMLSAAPKPDSE